MLHRFEIHSSLKLSPTALLCYRLFARLVVGNKSRKLAQEQKRGMKLGKREKFFLLSPPPPPSIFQFLLLSPQLPSLRRTGSLSSAEVPAGYPYKKINNRKNRKRVGGRLEKASLLSSSFPSFPARSLFLSPQPPHNTKEFKQEVTSWKSLLSACYDNTLIRPTRPQVPGPSKK